MMSRQMSQDQNPPGQPGGQMGMPMASSPLDRITALENIEKDIATVLQSGGTDECNTLNIKSTFVVLEYLASVESNNIDNDVQKILWICVNNLKLYYNSSHLAFYYHVNLKRWIEDILLNTEKCPDPYLRLELLCFKYIFKFHFSRYFWVQMEERFIITIIQINLDKYVSTIELSLLNSHILINVLERLKNIDTSSGIAFMKAARKLNRNQSDLQVEFYAKLFELLSELILIDVRYMCVTIVREEILDVRLINHPLMTKSARSTIASITNCILLLQAKLLNRVVESTRWSMIRYMEDLRDHMAMEIKPSSTKASLQRFLTERAHGSFNINDTKKVYDITIDIKQINVSEKFTDMTYKKSPEMLDIIFRALMHQINSIYYSMNSQHRDETNLNSEDETEAPNFGTDRANFGTDRYGD